MFIHCIVENTESYTLKDPVLHYEFHTVPTTTPCPQRPPYSAPFLQTPGGQCYLSPLPHLHSLRLPVPPSPQSPGAAPKQPSFCSLRLQLS